MLDRPRLSDEHLITCVKASYGLTVSALEFLPLGYDSNAGVYRVQAEGQSYFLKVRRDAVHELSVHLPRYLHAQGIEQVVAPLPTITHDPWGKAGPFTVLLYPFIEESSARLSDAQWIEFGAVLKRLHTTPLPDDLLSRVPRETFVPHPHYMGVITRHHAAVGNAGTYDHPLQQQLAAVWRERYQEVDRIITRTVELGRILQTRMRADPPECVLCHSDIHTGNLLLTAQGQLFVVDWDQPLLAPRERDLMFVTVGAFVSDPQTEALFFQGYGPTPIAPMPMAYYRYERTMEDLAGFAELVFDLDVSDAARQDALEWFMRQFEPGDAADAAYRADCLLGM